MKGFIKVQDAHTHDILTISLSDIKVIRQSKARCSIETTSDTIFTDLSSTEIEYMMMQAGEETKEKRITNSEIFIGSSILTLLLLCIGVLINQVIR